MLLIYNENTKKKMGRLEKKETLIKRERPSCGKRATRPRNQASETNFWTSSRKVVGLYVSIMVIPSFFISSILLLV